MSAKLLRIHGKVQGVGYRNAMEVAATRMGLCGWVRNRSDGTVEALVEGDSDLVEMLIRWALSGPPLAEVRSVEVADAEAAGNARFVRLPTV